MEIESQNSKKDLINFIKIGLKKRFRRFCIFNLLLLAGLIGYGSSVHYKWTAYVILVLCFLAYVAIMGYFLPLLKADIKLNKLIAKDDFVIKKKKNNNLR